MDLYIINISFLALILASCCFLGFLKWKIWRHRRKLSRAPLSRKQPKRIFVISWNRAERKSTKTGSPVVLDNLSDVTFMALMLLTAPTLILLQMHVTGAPLIMSRLLVNSVFFLIMPLSIYARKPHVRTTLAREIKAIF